MSIISFVRSKGSFTFGSGFLDGGDSFFFLVFFFIIILRFFCEERGFYLILASLTVKLNVS